MQVRRDVLRLHTLADGEVCRQAGFDRGRIVRAALAALARVVEGGDRSAWSPRSPVIGDNIFDIPSGKKVIGSICHFLLPLAI